MQLLTGPAHDRCHVLTGAGAYEWWYTDALTDDGEWGVVAILFRGMPMSPAYLSDPTAMAGGFAVSVYHRGTRIAFAFGDVPLEACRFAGQGADVRVGDASLHIDADDVLHVAIARRGRGIERSVDVALRLESSCTMSTPEAYSQDHAWVLARPRAAATLRIALAEGAMPPSCVFEGSALAYHDHNMGVRAMSSDFGDWYWGRVHGPSSSIVYLTTPASMHATTHVVDVDAEGRVAPWQSSSIMFERRRVNFMGLRMHRSVVLAGVDARGVARRVVCDNDVVCEDGPFYQRYISRWTDGDVLVGYGMSEYMDVQRLRAPWIRPFLRLPWKQMMHRSMA